MFWTWFILTEFSMTTKTPSRALKRGRFRNLNVRSLFKKRKNIASPNRETYSLSRQIYNAMHQTRPFAEQWTLNISRRQSICQVWFFRPVNNVTSLHQSQLIPILALDALHLIVCARSPRCYLRHCHRTRFCLYNLLTFAIEVCNKHIQPSLFDSWVYSEFHSPGAIFINFTGDWKC